MEKSCEITQEVPVIDQRILAAVERNGEYLGLTEWLERHTCAIEIQASDK